MNPSPDPKSREKPGEANSQTGTPRQDGAPPRIHWKKVLFGVLVGLVALNWFSNLVPDYSAKAYAARESFIDQARSSMTYEGFSEQKLTNLLETGRARGFRLHLLREGADRIDLVMEMGSSDTPDTMCRVITIRGSGHFVSMATTRKGDINFANNPD